MSKYCEKLLSPLRIGSITVKNRVVLPPMNTNFGNVNGEVTEQTIAYYAARARGGCGLITVDATSVDPLSKKHGLQPMLYDERFIPGYGKLTEHIHRYGAKASIEIIHYGSETPYPPGEKPSVSGISSIPDNPQHILTVPEILDIEEKFVRTAEYARLAGFDAVTLHGTHGYLIAQFLSPLYNRRTDEYGGSFENRFRFLGEIMEKIRLRLGSGFPIIVRFSADEYIRGGRTLAESIRLAQALEQAGAAALDISAAVPSSYMFTIAPGSLTGMKGLQRENAAAIRQAVQIPVIIAGGIRTPELAEELLTEGAADLIALGRAQIADPAFVIKTEAGTPERIRPCISCLTCFYSLGKKKCLRCAVNPEAGREYELTLPPAPAVGRSAAVIGGGPAGMTAAAVLAERGFRTSLFEKTDSLGGSLLPASVPSGKSDLARFGDWLASELKEKGVTVYTGRTYSADAERELQPEVVINACGAAFSRRIPGSDGPAVMTAAEALRDPGRVGREVLIIGAGNTGCETAEALSGDGTAIRYLGAKDLSGDLEYEVTRSAENCRSVTLVEFLPEAGRDIGRLHKPLLDIRLREAGATLLTCTRVDHIEADGTVVLEDRRTGRTECRKADTVILAGGMTPLPGWEDTDGKILYAGDQRGIGNIETAVADGYFTAREA